MSVGTPLTVSVGNSVDRLACPPPVVVEIWFLRCHGGRWTTLPAVDVAVDVGVHPHRYAAAAAGRAGIVADVVHSTSWRVDQDRVVLTYIVVTDTPLGSEAFDVHTDHDHRRMGTPTGHTADADGEDATEIPAVIHPLDVVHHALHHLALLARTNPSIIAALNPIALAALGPLAPAGAGVLPVSTAA